MVGHDIILVYGPLDVGYDPSEAMTFAVLVKIGDRAS